MSSMPDEPRREPGELVFSLLLLLASLFLAWQAWTIARFTSLSSAGVMPMLATGAMAAAGLVILGQTARRRPVAEQGAVRRFLAEITPPRLALFAAMIVLYMLALEPAGFLVSSFVFLFAGMGFLHRRSLALSLVVSAASLALIWLVFRHVFAVVLPAGRLF
ncbi:MAG: tripartite tricarboxylate transporter TctB family protein [Geminicoccaceae bacterium]